MRTMIAVPCMDMVHTFFFTSMLSMRKPEGTELAVASCSLIYEARHNLAVKAINDGFDRVLWMDSDMNFGPDLMERLEADLDQVSTSPGKIPSSRAFMRSATRRKGKPERSTRPRRTSKSSRPGSLRSRAAGSDA